jgi:hypothetical protein
MAANTFIVLMVSVLFVRLVLGEILSSFVDGLLLLSFAECVDVELDEDVDEPAPDDVELSLDDPDSLEQHEESDDNLDFVRLLAFSFALDDDDAVDDFSSFFFEAVIVVLAASKPAELDASRGR